MLKTSNFKNFAVVSFIKNGISQEIKFQDFCDVKDIHTWFHNEHNLTGKLLCLTSSGKLCAVEGSTVAFGRYNFVQDRQIQELQNEPIKRTKCSNEQTTLALSHITGKKSLKAAAPVGIKSKPAAHVVIPRAMKVSYVMLNKLGRGSFGEVFQAVRVDSRSKYAKIDGQLVSFSTNFLKKSC
jgi:hypothetical protein